MYKERIVYYVKFKYVGTYIIHESKKIRKNGEHINRVALLHNRYMILLYSMCLLNWSLYCLTFYINIITAKIYHNKGLATTCAWKCKQMREKEHAKTEEISVKKIEYCI